MNGIEAPEDSNLGSLDDEASQNSDLPVKVREVATGRILSPHEAPKASQLDAWLETHLGYEVVSRDEKGGEGDDSSEDSDDSDDEIDRNLKNINEKPNLEALDEETRHKLIIKVKFRDFKSFLDVEIYWNFF